MITNRQMALLIFIIAIGDAAVYIPGLMASSAGRGYWIPLILSSLVFGFSAFIIVKLNGMHSGKMLFEYSRDIIGKAGAYILGFLFLIYFVIVTEYLLVSFTNIVRNNFLYNTPPWFELLLGIPIFGYAAYKGVRNISRMAEITGVILLIIATFSHLAMLFQGELQNIEPPFNPYELGKYLSAMKEAMIPFLGIEALTIVPIALSSKKKAPKVAFFSVAACGLFFVFITLTSIAMIGIDDIVNYTDPLVVALRRVEIAPIEFLTRIDIFYLTAGFAGFFVYLMIEYCAAVEYVCKIFPKISRLAVVITVGAILFILSFFVIPIDNLRKEFGVYAVYAIPIASIGVPLLLLIISKVRKHGSKTG